MTFDEVLAQVQELLQQEKRVSYRGLKRRFALDDEYLEDLKEELIGAKQLAIDEDGRFLVWTGGAAVVSDQLLVVSPQPPAPSTQHPDAPRSTLHALRSEAERRQLTVMFCDLVGSTTLSTQLDPEELREVVRTYQQVSAAVIERFGGHIAQYLGDGLLVYFGYPVAHEDDAARAVRAGLEIVETLQEWVPSPLAGEGQSEGVAGARRAVPLQIRIGIHTGPVVVGERGGGSRHEQLALGETPNIAARIQGQAEPDTVIISTATYRLVEGLFECEDRGQPELKGALAPLTLYRVIEAEEAQSRFEVVARKGLTPLVGREYEYGLLRERWERAKDGEGQVVLLGGEPGIGKSRLVEALKETVEHEGAGCLELRCSPYAQNSALQPVIEHLQRVLGFLSEDSSEAKLRKLEATLVGATGRSPLHETVPLFASLLSLPLPERYPPLTLSSQKQKEKTRAAIVAWLCEAAQPAAVCYAWEDLHWADPSTLELLTLFLDQVPTTRLLAVLTYRPEFTPSWGTRSYLNQLTLSRLGRAQVELMVEKVTGGKDLSSAVVQQIVSKTDGVPLFVEELTKSVVESVGAQHATPLQLGIPATLHDALMARLDRLGPAKEIAQLGATLGREFDYALLQAVSPLDENTLQRGLRQLVEAELVYRSGALPQVRYLFKHALVQDAAYQSLLKSRRQQLHQHVAQVLVEQFPETVATQPELVAHHYTEAGLIVQAIPYWERAGQRAIQRSANTEAVGHLKRGIELLQTLPETVERAQQELTFQTALGAALIATRGYAAPEVGHAYGRARELCQQVGETPQLFPVLLGLWFSTVMRSNYQTGLEHARQLFSVAQSGNDSGLLVGAHYALGWTLSHLGDLTAGQEHFLQGIAVYDLQKHRSLPFDPGGRAVGCLNWAAWTLLFLGYPEQALKRIGEGLTLARKLANPFSVCFALIFAGYIHRFRREWRFAQDRAEEVITLATEQGFPHWVQYGNILHGWALAQQGQAEEGIAEIHQGLAGQRAAGTEASREWFLSFLAEAYGKAKQLQEGLRVLTEALQCLYRTEERIHEAEVYWLKGELLLQPGVQSSELSVQKAEACFQKALDVARQQKAKWWDLRASTSLARLWQQQGKKKEAHQMLAEIYYWFTEGFDTKDLQEAKALLEELES